MSEIYPMNQKITSFYGDKGWSPFPFQLKTWKAIQEGKSGIINAPTGMGKTYAAWMGIINRELQSLDSQKRSENNKGDYQSVDDQQSELADNKLKAIWITPLRALGTDIASALQQATDHTSLGWKVQTRTGDTSYYQKRKQQTTPPQALVTTPESLHILLSYPGAKELFSNLEYFVVDEWHELVGNKRGTMVELALSRLKALSNNKLQIWGISATIGNMQEATKALFGNESGTAKIITTQDTHKTVIKTIYPDKMETYSWAGHIGTRLAKKVLRIIKKKETTILFTNTRGQTEIWYKELLRLEPGLSGRLAIHHGSMSKSQRNWVEHSLNEGKLKAVVATSSLDLGVDFRPVENVIQIGSPKSVSRFLQRAGRSGHAPGETSIIHFLPTYNLELIDIAAIKSCIKQNKVEPKPPIIKPFDLLIQYLITIACGDGFIKTDFFEQIKSTHAYKNITRKEFEEALEFVENGGSSLARYDQYHKLDRVAVTDDAQVIIDKQQQKSFASNQPLNKIIFKVTNKRTAKLHRANIGVIASDPMLKVKYKNGQQIGMIEENFLARLNKGENFWLSGKNLELVKISRDTAIVTNSIKQNGKMARWFGGRLQLSSQLADEIIFHLDTAAELLTEQSNQETIAPDIKKLMPVLKIQQQRSSLPKKDELLVEVLDTQDGQHIFCFPLAGRTLNSGIATLWAYRISQMKKITFSVSVNDFGFELLSDQKLKVTTDLITTLISTNDLYQDIQGSANLPELVERQFRDIAKISGLIDQNYPGEGARLRYLQSQAQLIYQVFKEKEPEHLLLKQAQQQVMDSQLQAQQITQKMKSLQKKKFLINTLERFSPLSFPIMVDRLRSQVSSETFAERVRKIIDQQLEVD